jgi:cofilin
LNDQWLDVYQDMKLKNKFKYIIYRLSDSFSEVVVDQCAEEGTLDELVGALSSTECRYAVYDFDYGNVGKGKGKTTALISWIPEASKMQV